MAPPPLVVVGNGMVGQRFVDDLVANGGTDHWDITVIGEEPVAAYDRVALSSFFDGASAEDLNLCDPASLQGAGVSFRFGRRAESIDRERKLLTLDDGSQLPYEHLVLATGSYPFVPPAEGHDQPGCFVYRTLEDLERIRTWADGKTRGVVVGGGLLGLEAANALANLWAEHPCGGDGGPAHASAARRPGVDDAPPLDRGSGRQLPLRLRHQRHRG